MVLPTGRYRGTPVEYHSDSGGPYGEWSEPRPIGSDSAAPVSPATFASLTSTRGGAVFLFGNDVRNFGPAFVAENPLSAWEIAPHGGRSLGRPPGTFRFAYPRALVDARDRLHLLWGEPAGEARPIRGSEWRDEELVSIWTSVYESNDGWSAPRPLFEGRDLRLSWHNMLAPVHSQAQRSSAVLAVPIDPHGAEGHGMVLVSFNASDNLFASVVHTTSQVAYSSAVSCGARAFLGFIAPAPVQRFGRDRNSVFVQSSGDGGLTWSPAVLVSRSGGAAAFEVKALIGPDGTVHLVWQQEHRGRIVFRHVVSRDGGESWSLPDDLAAPPSAYHFQAAVGKCGTLHLVWEHRDWPADLSHIDHATWCGHWSAITHSFTTLTVNMPVLHLAHDGRLLLAFQGKLATSDEAEPLVTMYSELAPGKRW
ncbi:MAG TPA: sialidase family protein [Gemmatimonadaceae bacterium]|nr:sialidase family protein [Gemmatimonadaceae bacterium]